MFDQLKDSLVSQEGIRCDRLRRSLSSSSLHINRSQLQQLYNSLPKSQMKNYQLPTIASKNKSMCTNDENLLPAINPQQGNPNSNTDKEDIR